MKRILCGIAVLVCVCAGDQSHRLIAQTNDDPVLPTLFYVPYPSNTGSVVTVSNGTDLQNELNNAVGGKTILLTADATFTPPDGSSFVLPAIASADDQHWIIVRSASST